jgi:hypothetical protein
MAGLHAARRMFAKRAAWVNSAATKDLATRAHAHFGPA